MYKILITFNYLRITEGNIDYLTFYSSAPREIKLKIVKISNSNHVAFIVDYIDTYINRLIHEI